MLGAACCFELRGMFDVTGSYLSHNVQIEGVETIRLGLGNRQDTITAIASAKPELIINTAAMTAVDLCESERETAYNANVICAENAALAAKECGAKLIHMSTDYVFDGKKGMYSETDRPKPLGYYAETKLLGEGAVSKANPEAAIVRATIIGWNPLGAQINIAPRIVDALRNGIDMPLFTDQYSSPILVNDLADIFAEIFGKGLSGICHAGTKGKASKYELGLEICRAFDFEPSALDKTSFSEFERSGMLKAKRPLDTSLSTAKLEKALGREMPALADCIKRFRQLEEEKYLDNFK